VLLGLDEATGPFRSYSQQA